VRTESSHERLILIRACCVCTNTIERQHDVERPLTETPRPLAGAGEHNISSNTAHGASEQDIYGTLQDFPG